MKTINVKSEEFYTLIFPCKTFLLTVGGNIITVSWLMPVSKNPPILVTSIKPQRHSYKLLREYMDFVVNVPPMDYLDDVFKCGVISGREVDKFKVTGFTKGKARKVNSCIINECIAFIECKVRDFIKAGDHDLVLGDVIECYVKEGYYSNGIYVLGKAKPIFHLGGNKFTTTVDYVKEAKA